MRSKSADSISMKDDTKIEIIEDAATNEAELYLQRFDLIAAKGKDELAALNKKVLRKLDWKFLPCITMMLLMK